MLFRSLLADNKVSQIKVQTGRRFNDRVEISSGLKGSETVVVNGAAFLAQGDTVRVNDTALPTSAQPKSP